MLEDNRRESNLVAKTLVMMAIAALLGCAPPDAASTAAETTAEPVAFSASAEEAAVRQILATQVEAWNRFDLDEFMASYWKSPQLRFTSGGSVRRGWQATLDRYRTTYPDASAMGRLSFEDLEVTIFSERWASVFGRYVLERESDRPTGLFTLLLEKQDGVWRIVSDHTSTD